MEQVSLSSGFGFVSIFSGYRRCGDRNLSTILPMVPPYLQCVTERPGSSAC